MKIQPPRQARSKKKPGGLKKDTGKPRMDLLPDDALEDIARVLGFGADKYAPGNWALGIPISKLIAAQKRHMKDFIEGRDFDPESGLHQMAHVACNDLFILWMLKHRPDLDDRWINLVKGRSRKHA